MFARQRLPCWYLKEERYIWNYVAKGLSYRAHMQAKYASTVCNSHLEYRCTSEGSPGEIHMNGYTYVNVLGPSVTGDTCSSVMLGEINLNSFPRLNGQYLWKCPQTYIAHGCSSRLNFENLNRTRCCETYYQELDIKTLRNEPMPCAHG